MKKSVRNSGGRVNVFMCQLAAQKKKTVMALCLIAVMVFMWVRVLARNKTRSAEAMTQETMMDRAVSHPRKSGSELKISFVELPQIEGSGELARDFFTVESWRDFVRAKEGRRLSGVEEVSVVSGDGGEVVRRVAKKIKLEAIELGENPQVFINDRLLSVGDKLLVRDGVNAYECEVVGIEENTVRIRCGEAEITLKLTKVFEEIVKW